MRLSQIRYIPYIIGGLMLLGVLGIYLSQTLTVGATILYPSGGGTGIGTNPTYGKVLVGNSGGTYTLTATSSLGITATEVYTGTLSTSTTPTQGQLAYWINPSAYPATIGSLSTSTLYGTGTGGQVLMWSGSAPVWAATSTQENPLTFNYPLSRSTNTISFNGLSTSTAVVVSTIPYFSSDYQFANVATSSLAVGASISSSGTLGSQIGGTNTTLSLNMANPNTWTALQTFTTASTTGIHTVNELCFDDGKCMSTPSVTGDTIRLFPWNQSSGYSTYEGLRTIATTTQPEVDESCAATSGYCASDIDSYVSTSTIEALGPLTLSKIPAGVWEFYSYTYVSNTGGNTYLEFTLSRLVGTNETQMFQATTTDINITTVGLVELTTAQPAFTFNPTDRLVLRVRVWTDSGSAKTAHFVYQGNAHYSFVKTPATIASEAVAFLNAGNTFTGANTFNALTTLGNASTTLLTASYASSTSYYGAGLATCNAATNALTWSGGTFGCNTITAGAGGNAIGTSTEPGAVGNLAMWATKGSYPELLGYVATSSPTLGLGLTGTLTVIGTGHSLSLATTSIFTGTINQIGFFTGTNTLEGRATSTLFTFDGSGDCGTDLVCTGGHTHSGYVYTAGDFLTLTSQDFDVDTGAIADGATTVLSTADAIYDFVRTATSTMVGTTNITTLGTIGTGTWNATDVAVGAGGTGLSISTETGLLVFNSGVASVVATSSLGLDFYPAFTYGTTTWAGTTTIPLGTAFIAETWFAVQCFTDAGTLWLEFGDGTNWTTGLISASTTAGTFTFSTNNTFTAGEKRYFRAGTPATSPTVLSCTVRKR